MLVKDKKSEFPYSNLEGFLKETDFSLAREVIQKGFSPFPDNHAVSKLFYKPNFLKLFLEEGINFKDLFQSSYSNSGLTTGFNIMSLTQIFKVAYLEKTKKKVAPESDALLEKPEIFGANNALIEFMNILFEYNYFNSEHYKSNKELIDNGLEQEQIKDQFNGYVQATLESKKIKDEVVPINPTKKNFIL